MPSRTNTPEDSISASFRRWLRPTKPAEQPQQAAASLVQEKVSAALSLDDPAICPYCKLPMKPCIAAGTDAYICDNDRYVAPQPNSATEGTL